MRASLACSLSIVLPFTRLLLPAAAVVRRGHVVEQGKPREPDGATYVSCLLS